MCYRILFLTFCVLQSVTFGYAQTFSSTPISFSPNNHVDFFINLPLVSLDVNNYVPSQRLVYAGQPITFYFYTFYGTSGSNAVFQDLRWDDDLDASNGVQWHDWFSQQSTLNDVHATVTKTYSTPGKYILTFELRLTNTAGQTTTRQKQYELHVAPLPTAVYQDDSPAPDQLYYWEGVDNAYNRPVLVLPGYDPNPGGASDPGFIYAAGFDLVQEARNQGYDVFILRYGYGGADITLNKNVFLGSTKFLHDKLNGADAAVQVVGISMGGVVARYGLAWAEDDAASGLHPGQYIDHFVNTFISFDAPQQGAHVNTNLQGVLKTYGNAVQQYLLTATAAEQMLYEDVYDPSGGIHNGFYQSISGLNNSNPLLGYTNGYPRRCKNYAVSNGNLNTNYPTLTTSSPLATLIVYANMNYGDIITLPLAEATYNFPSQNRDLWPGSTFPLDLTTLHVDGFKYYYFGWPIFGLGAAANWHFTVNYNPGFIPTESATDLDGYVRNTDGSLSGGTSWFDGLIEQTTFHRHDEVTSDSKNQIMTWLNNNRTNPYLGRPSGVAGIANSPKHITITFTDNSAFEDGHKVERKTGGGSFVEVATLPPNTAQYNDYCVGPSSSYTYRIRSYSGTTTSSYSTETSVTTPALGSIAAPANLAATKVEPAYVQLTWNPVAGAAGYRIYRTSSGGACPSFSTDVTSTSYTDFSLSQQQQYSFQVAAINGNVEGNGSNVAVAQMPHLASNSTSVLSSNSQRKLVQTNDSKLNMVYESGGAIFKTISANNGNTWSKEALVSRVPNGDTAYRSPSLILGDDGATVYTMYERTIANGQNSEHSVMWDGGQSVYSPIYPYTFCGRTDFLSSAFTYLTSYSPNPVAVITKTTGTAPPLLAVISSLRDDIISPTLEFSVGRYPYVSACSGWPFQSYWSSFQFSNSYVTDPRNPALAVRVFGGSTKTTDIVHYWFLITWEEPGDAGGIKFAYGTYQNTSPPVDVNNISWFGPYSVVSNSPLWVTSHPTIAVDGAGDVTIAYEYKHLVAHRGYIRTQKRSASSNYGSILEEHTFPNLCLGDGYLPHAPAVTDYRYSSTTQNDLTLTWYQDDGTILAAQYVSGSWTDPYVLANGGQQANVSGTFTSSNPLRYLVYASTDGPPYSITTSQVTSATAPPEPIRVAPEDQAVDVPIPVQFNWNCVPGATSYTLEVDDDADFSSIVESRSGLTTTGVAIDLSPYTQYYWRVKAINVNGSGSWSGSVFTTGSTSSGGGCPFVFTWDGTRFVEDNNILPASEYTDSSQGDVTDIYKLRRRIVANDSSYLLQIREFEEERSRFDRFQLFVIDHPTNTHVAVAEDGEVILYTMPMRMTQAILRGANVLDKLSASDSIMVEGSVGDVLSLRFEQLSTKVSTGASVDGGGVLVGSQPPPGDKKQRLGKIALGNSESHSGVFTFRRRPSVVYVPVGELDTTDLSLNVDERCYLDFASLAVRLPDRYQVHEAPLRRAIHSTQGNVKAQLLRSDSSYATLGPGEAIVLQFAKVPEIGTGERSYVLISKGRYVRFNNPPKTVAMRTPTTFALEQNYPNPFNPTTTFKYQLPATVRVELEVYNLVGQRIETLVHAVQGAGEYTASWDGRNAASGVYFIRMAAADLQGKHLFYGSKKLLLMK